MPSPPQPAPHLADAGRGASRREGNVKGGSSPNPLTPKAGEEVKPFRPKRCPMSCARTHTCETFGGLPFTSSPAANFNTLSSKSAFTLPSHCLHRPSRHHRPWPASSMPSSLGSRSAPRIFSPVSQLPVLVCLTLIPAMVLLDSSRCTKPLTA